MEIILLTSEYHIRKSVCNRKYGVKCSQLQLARCPRLRHQWCRQVNNFIIDMSSVYMLDNFTFISQIFKNWV